MHYSDSAGHSHRRSFEHPQAMRQNHKKSSKHGMDGRTSRHHRAHCIQQTLHIRAERYVSTTWGVHDNHKYLIELPITRLLYSGSSAVLFFFAIAGYVVSARSLQLMSVPNSQKKLMGSLSGSTFRGLFQLYITVGTTTLFWSFLAYLGSFQPMRPYIEKHRAEYFPGAWSGKNLPGFSTLSLQLKF